MTTVTMTELNQQVSAVTRRVIEQGETVQVTNRGRVVLRLVPEPAAHDDVLERLVASGLATAPRRGAQPRRTGDPAPLSRDLDEVLGELSADADV